MWVIRAYVPPFSTIRFGCWAHFHLWYKIPFAFVRVLRHCSRSGMFAFFFALSCCYFFSCEAPQRLFRDTNVEDDKPSASLSAVPPVCSMEREASAALVVTVLTPATVSSTRFRWAEAGASQGGNSPPPSWEARKRGVQKDCGQTKRAGCPPLPLGGGLVVGTKGCRRTKQRTGGFICPPPQSGSSVGGQPQGRFTPFRWPGCWVPSASRETPAVQWPHPREPVRRATSATVTSELSVGMSEGWVWGSLRLLRVKGRQNQMNRDSGNCVGARRWCERFTTPIVKAETRRLSILSKTPRRAKSNDW